MTVGQRGVTISQGPCLRSSLPGDVVLQAALEQAQEAARTAAAAAGAAEAELAEEVLHSVQLEPVLLQAGTCCASQSRAA